MTSFVRKVSTRQDKVKFKMAMLTYKTQFLICAIFLVFVGSIRGCNSSCSTRVRHHPTLGKNYNVDPVSTTVSGVSNGGAYAAHISFIYSSLIRGAGIFAASPYPMMYFLGKGNPKGLFDISAYYPVIDAWSALGAIDSTENFKGFKAYVFMGLMDVIIMPKLIANVVEQYKHYGADVKDVTKSISCGHCIPTRNMRNDDARIGFIQDLCNVGFQGVFDMFEHFYGDSYKEPESPTAQTTGQLIRVDLSEFYPDCRPELYSMRGTAWAYVPKACEESAGNFSKVRCRLHLAFHGYEQPLRANLVGSHTAFVEEAGYLQAADANNIIIVFPESRLRGYDIIGFTGPEKFAQKDGVQNIAIKKMIERITLGI